MIKLYSWSTPNGRKVSIMLEELGVKYSVIPINISKDEQFTKEFQQISPTNKIPAIVDSENNQYVFESGSILLYLAKKYNNFFNFHKEWETYSLLMYQLSEVGPFLGQAHQFLYYNKVIDLKKLFGVWMFFLLKFKQIEFLELYVLMEHQVDIQ